MTNKRTIISQIITLLHVTTLSCHPQGACNKYLVKLHKYSGVCYNERMLQRTVLINKIRMLKRTKMLQRTRRNTIGRHSTRMQMTCRAFPL